MDPTTVEVGLSSEDVTATFHVTDETGTQRVLARLWAVGQGVATPNVDATLMSGTPQDGTWQATYTIPRGGPEGVWQVSITGMQDVLTNVSSGLLIPASRLAAVVVTSAHAPGAPKDVHATPADGKASVSWKAPSNNGMPITSYVVTADPDRLTRSVDGDQTSVVFDGLTNGTGYTFTVVAVNAIGAGSPSEPSNYVIPNSEFETGPTATITGDLQAQAKLTAHGGTPSPEPDSYKYQWFADGRPIEGQQFKSMVLGDDQVGHKISVMVTARREGYVDASDLSDATASVAPGVSVALSKPMAQTGRTVRVTATGLQRSEPYSITIADVPVKSGKAGYRGTVSTTVRVSASLPNGYLPLVITAASGRHDNATIFNAQPRTLSLSFNSTTVRANSTVSLAVSSLGPFEPVTVRFGGRTISPPRTTARSDGQFVFWFSAGTQLGEREVTVRGVNYRRTGSATVLVTP